MDRNNLTVNDVRVLEDFFLMAMRHGWASGTAKISIPELPGAKCIPYQDERKQLYLLDWYFAPRGSVNNGSAGTTMIWYQNIPVWVMHYGGIYREEAVPFLKKALSEAYMNGIFKGGRGLNYHGGGGSLVYVNEPTEGSSFKHFSGNEFIVELESCARVGWHKYWGMLL